MGSIIFKDIPGFSGRYQATRDGRIYSLVTGKYLKESVIKTGKRCGRRQLPYHLVGLRHEGKSYRMYVQRLVMLAFEGEMPADCDCVMHLNDNPEDNRVENLKYGSFSDNMKDCVKKGRKVNNDYFHGKKGKLHWKSIPVILFKDNKEVGRFESMRIAEKETGIDICTISNSIKHNRQTFGYQFKKAI